MQLKSNYPRSGPLGMINGNTMPTTPQKPVKIKIGKAAAPMITVLVDMLKRKKIYRNDRTNITIMGNN